MDSTLSGDGHYCYEETTEKHRGEDVERIAALEDIL